MADTNTTVSIKVEAQGAKAAAQDISTVDASVSKTGAAAASAAQSFGGLSAATSKAGAGFGSLSKFASTAGIDKIAAQMQEVGVHVNTSSRHIQSLAAAINKVQREKAFQQLAQEANLSTLKIARLRAEMGDMRGAFGTILNGAQGAAGKVAVFAAAVLYASKVCLDAMLALDRLNKAYATIGGSAQAGAEQLAYIAAVSQKLGLQFQDTAAAAKGFFAAVQGTSLASDANRIFSAVSTGASALSLSGEEVQRIFLALGQMISKGKVQAEELRGQLGEALPGAFQLAAKAVGMTTAELDKFMADGKLTAEDLLPKMADAMQNQFAVGAEEAAKGVQAAVNRMSTAWENFKAGILDSDAVISTLKAITGLLNVFNKRNEEKKAVKELEDSGVKPAITRNIFGVQLEWFSKEQIEHLKVTKAEIAARGKAVKDAAIAQEKILGDMRQAVTESLKGTADYEVAQLERVKKESLAKIDAGIDAMRKVGEKAEVIASAQAERAKVAAALDAKIEKAANKGQKKNSSAVRQQLKYDKSDLGLDVLRQEIANFEEALNPALDKYSAMLARIEAERKTAIAKAQADAQKLLLDKKATPEQAAEFEDLTVQNVNLDAERKKQELQNQNLRDRADFYKELSALSGEYGVSLEYQNQLLAKQRDEWAGIVPNIDDVNKMIELQRRELARDPWSGWGRAAQKTWNDVSNGANNATRAFETFHSDISSALTDLAMGAQVSFSQILESWVRMLIEMQMQAAVAGLMKAGTSFLGDLFGFGGGSSAAGNAVSFNQFQTGAASEFDLNTFAHGGFASPSGLPAAGGVLTAPTFFHDGVSRAYAQGGLSVAGEAGPEVFMPATRMRDGNFGVRVQNAASAPVINVAVNIHNEGNGQIKESRQRQTRMDGAGMVIDLFLQGWENNTGNVRNVLAQGA